MDDLTLLHESEWFDAEWYARRYPDVAASGLSPAEHFLKWGRRLQRRPSPRFDTRWYLKRYSDIAHHTINPLIHFLKHGQREGRSPVAMPGEWLELALWRQHLPSGALLGLRQLVENQDGAVRAQAIWALARWHASHGQWQEVAQLLGRLGTQMPRYPRQPGPWLLEIEARRRLGDAPGAFKCLEALRREFKSSPEIALAMVNLAGGAGIDQDTPASLNAAYHRLGWLNQLWAGAGLSFVTFQDGIDSSQALDSLTINAPPLAPEDDTPLVSVIVPVFNAETTLATALGSLAQSRGVRLEVIIVDDGSRDASCQVARRFTQHDERFRLLPLARNVGAYAARNAGLALAQGDLITVHDSDDWSHPDKLRAQVRALTDNPEWMACLGDWVRCLDDLSLTQWRMDTGWALENLSSLMFRRQVYETLGYWDRVRVSGDREFMNRIKAHWGHACIGRVLKGIPLALGRDHEASLTQTHLTHLSTMFKGLRHDYQQAASRWHASASNLYMPYNPAHRPFSAPIDNLINPVR